MKILKKMILDKLNDELFLKLLFKKVMKYNLDLNKPKTFNEKLQWLKLYDRKDIYTTMVDKYEAKKFVSNLIGEEYIIPTLGLYNSFDEIDFEQLPNKFVIKCTHDSGGLVIVRDKSKLDIINAKKKIEESLKRNFYYNNREWPYKNVKPRIIAEKYIEDTKQKDLRDYKFFCFDGEPKIMYLSEGLENHETAGISFYDMDFNLTDCKRSDYRTIAYTPDKPKNFEKMKELASILSKDIPHLRVDFYEIDGKILFGELTFTTCAGFVPFEDKKWDKILGGYINLDKVNREKNEK